MSQIHPSAVIDPQVVLGEDVSVGPNCVIQGDVTLGDHCKLIANVFIQGPIKIGADNTFYPGAAVGFAPQDLKFSPDTPGKGVVIGDSNVFRENTTVHRATKDKPTLIGNKNFFMVNAHVGHDVIIANGCMFANNVSIAGHVNIQDDVVIGGHSAIHQFCALGRKSMVGGAGGTRQSLPPFCLSYTLGTVGSLNIVGLRRSGYRSHIKPLKRAFEILFKENHTNIIAVEMIDSELGDDPLCQEFSAFVKNAARGLPRYSQNARHT